MLSRILTTAVAAAFLFGAAAAPTPTFAEGAKKEETKAATKKELTPQQQKMKDCGPKWADYKKEKNVKGRAEYRKFMSTCLKG